MGSTKIFSVVFGVAYLVVAGLLWLVLPPTVLRWRAVLILPVFIVGGIMAVALSVWNWREAKRAKSG